MDVSTPENQQVIERMATSDEDEAVRVAAVDKVASVTVLQRVIGDQSNNLAVAKSVENRIVQLLSDNDVSEDEANALLTTQAATYAPLLAINCANETIRLSALEKIENESLLVNVLEQSRFHDVRLACANRITTDDNVKLALSACRSRDKVVAKLLQSRVDEKAADQAKAQAQEEAVSSTLSAMQALSESVWSPQYAARLAALKAKWDSIDSSMRADSQTAFDAACSAASITVDEHDKKIADEAATVQRVQVSSEQPKERSKEEQTSAAVETVVAKDDPARDALLEKLKPLTIAQLEAFDKPNDVESGSDSEKLIAHAQSIAVLFNPPFDIAKGRPGAITERIKRTKALLDTESILPGIAVKECAYMAELNEHADALAQRLDKAKQESVDRAKATHRQFGALAATIADGKWGPASSMFRRLQKKVDAMEPAERNQFNEKMTRAEKQLAEMADWQDFAARPKLEALCVSMEALPEQELKPESLAKEIKSMQAQWKALGASRASNELWTRFKTAGDTAYEPCKAFFAQKQEERVAKQEAKIKLVSDLEQQFKDTNWEEPDWKTIQRSVNNAKREWGRNRVTDRKPDRAVENRFSDALKPIEAKLAEQYDANVLEKRDLIEKIQKLAEGEINQHSANQAKRLQSAWKQVGIVRRKDDQALWEEFNAHAKVIYKHQHEAQREKYQASMSHVFRAREIIKTLRKISKSGEQDEVQVQALQTEFQALEDFPDKDKKFLLRDFRGALDACSKMQETASKKRAQAEVSEIGRLVDLCDQLEVAVESPDAASATLRDDVAHAWENSQASVAKETLSHLIKRRDAALKHLDAGTKYDYDKNEAQRRQLLIQMEILADKDTPAEDKALRMQYQLENLREGMTSSAVVDKRAELKKLVAQWHAMAPASQRVKDSLHSRYLTVTNQ